MTAAREDLRDDLRAMVAAAPELSEEERDHLTDVFLDRLESGYQLVPRNAGRSPAPISSPPRGGFPFPLRGVVSIVLVVAVLMMAVRALAFAAGFAHLPVFLFVVLMFLALRFFVWRPRRLYR
ncbi:MAG TPA: hypothetical protein VFB58_15700 [Chloroflexota bacterium]|nr:hypothetical protein [Chloroflexota bacterium]